MLEAFADSGGDTDMLKMIDATIIRAHRSAASEKGGTQNQALGRSRGGFSSKIHLRVNAAGLPIAATLTPGETHDVRAYDDLMVLRDRDPGLMLALIRAMTVTRSGRTYEIAEQPPKFQLKATAKYSIR